MVNGLEYSETRAASVRNLGRAYSSLELSVSDRLILDLCAGTGQWSEPYRSAGYQVKQIDISEKNQDVRLYKRPGCVVHGILAAPPCTVFSWARWREPSSSELVEALSVVDACLRIIYAANPAWWCLENPRGRLIYYLGRPTLKFDPCDYGDPWTKRTHLWGRFVPPAKRKVAPLLKNYIQELGTASKRAITPPGFAQAFFEVNP